ncbi:MAG: hypothetical protein AAGE86_02290 [Pseudomonadota bacterium]
MTAETISTGSAVLDDIAEVIGFAAALDLGVEFRGERVYIPKDPAKQPRIAEAIGEDRARVLCDAKWRTHVSMPMGVVLHHKVKQMAETGKFTRRAIAKDLRIREARVYEILRKWREDESQPRLL